MEKKKQEPNIKLTDEGNERNMELQKEVPNKQFICHECGNSYDRRRRLVQHMLKHETTNEKTFKCEPCGKTFPLECYFNKHNKRKHAGSKEFNCLNNKNSFPTSDQLENRELTHEFEKAMTATGNLQQQFDNQKSWQIRGDQAFDINQCDLSSCNILGSEPCLPSARADEKVELGTEEDNTMQQCDHCGELLLKTLFNDHLLTHVDGFKCGPCDRPFLYKAHWIRHNKNVHGLMWDGKDGFYMPKAKPIEEMTERQIKRLKYKFPLENYKPVDEDSFDCEQCEKSFSDSSSLRQHMSTHTLFKCNLCEVMGVKSKFATLEALEVHKLAHAGGKVRLEGKEIGCATEMQIKEEENAKQRMDASQINKQTTECLFYCDECEKPFKNSSGLKEHKKTRKKLECRTCHYQGITARFTSIEELEKHKLKHNQGGMPTWRVRIQTERDGTNKIDSQEHDINKQKAEHLFDRNQCKQSFASTSGSEMCKSQGYRLECNQWGKIDASKNVFKEPDNYHDTGVKNFHCDHCKTRFTRRDELEEHKISHTSGNLKLQNE